MLRLHSHSPKTINLLLQLVGIPTDIFKRLCVSQNKRFPNKSALKRNSDPWFQVQYRETPLFWDPDSGPVICKPGPIWLYTVKLLSYGHPQVLAQVSSYRCLLGHFSASQTDIRSNNMTYQDPIDKYQLGELKIMLISIYIQVVCVKKHTISKGFLRFICAMFTSTVMQRCPFLRPKQKKKQDKKVPVMWFL